MRKLWLVLAGGFAGAGARYLLGGPLLSHMSFLPGAHAALPYDILVINLTGALVIGLLFGLVEHGAPVSPDARLVLGTGFLGAYTTFSSYMVGADLLATHGHVLAAALYVVGSMAGGVALAYTGIVLSGLAWRAWRRRSGARMRARSLAGVAARGDNMRRQR